MIIGIDPGFSGAIAIILGQELRVFDMPVVKTSKGRDYVVPQMMAHVKEAVAHASVGYPMVGAIEKQGTRPQQGSTSGLKIGRGQGIWEGILTSHLIAYELVTPQRWKHDLGIAKGAPKDASRALAAQLFPAYAELFARVKDDGRAEATLIAEWRRRQG